MDNSIRNKKKFSFVYKLFACLLFILTLCLVVSILSLNVLSFLLSLLVIIVILGVSGLSILLLLKSRIKRIGLVISVLLLIGLASFINDFSQELKYLNNEIGRTSGAERRHYVRQRRRLWLSLIPFVKY